MKTILPGVPWLIAHKSMLGVNQPNKITLNGKDYVLWQNTTGEVFALDNICPHMQAPLSQGWICRVGKTLQIHVIYPETEKQTKTFVLVFAQASSIVIQLLKRLLLRGIEDIVKQDNRAVESLYPRQKAKVKLPNEEIMFYAEKIYNDWST